VQDDERGRKAARRYGPGVTRTIGLLIEEQERDLISSMRRKLDRLVEAGLWIDSESNAKRKDKLCHPDV
jgi:predicted nucleic acid-binding protein